MNHRVLPHPVVQAVGHTLKLVVPAFPRLPDEFVPKNFEQETVSFLDPLTK